MLIAYFDGAANYPTISIGSASAKVMVVLAGTVDGAAATKDNFDGVAALWTGGGYETHCAVGVLTGGTITTYKKAIDYSRSLSGEITFN